MIDDEQVIYEEVSRALRKRFEGITITGVEIVGTPPRFPAVSIVLKNSEVNTKYSTFESVENAARAEYEVNVYSNLVSEKKAKQQTKDIVAVIDGVMSSFFYIRSFNQPIPSADTGNTRRVARYKNANVI